MEEALTGVHLLHMEGRVERVVQPHGRRVTHADRDFDANQRFDLVRVLDPLAVNLRTSEPTECNHGEPGRGNHPGSFES
jgi:hypothetical protein